MNSVGTARLARLARVGDGGALGGLSVPTATMFQCATGPDRLGGPH